MKEDVFYKRVQIGSISQKGYLRCAYTGGALNVKVAQGVATSPGVWGIGEFHGQLRGVKVGFSGNEFTKEALVPDTMISFVQDKEEQGRK